MQSFSKVIKFGNNIETYEYERSPFTGYRRPIQTRDDEESRILENVDVEISAARRSDNVARSGVFFRRLVASQSEGDQPSYMLTLTYAENMGDIRTGWRDFRNFTNALRGRYGMGFRYICVPEFQERGAVHFHNVVWGFPEGVLKGERRDRSLAKAWGNGYIFIKKTYGDIGLGWYLSKYLGKARKDKRLAHQKAYSASRNCKRPIEISGDSPIWVKLDDLGIVHTIEKKRSEYVVPYLGRCIYKQLINVDHDTDSSESA